MIIRRFYGRSALVSGREACCCLGLTAESSMFTPASRSLHPSPPSSSPPLFSFFFFIFYFTCRAEDSGPLTQKENLPVRSLLLGDVQRPGSEAAYRVGPLRCHGDSKSGAGCPVAWLHAIFYLAAFIVLAGVSRAAGAFRLFRADASANFSRSGFLLLKNTLLLL